MFGVMIEYKYTIRGIVYRIIVEHVLFDEKCSSMSTCFLHFHIRPTIALALHDTTAFGPRPPGDHVESSYGFNSTHRKEKPYLYIFLSMHALIVQSPAVHITHQHNLYTQLHHDETHLNTTRRRSLPADTPTKPQTLSHMKENIDIAVDTAEELLTGAHGEDRHVRERVHALRLVGWQCTVDDEARDCVLVVHVVVGARLAGDVCGREAGAVFVYDVVFAFVGEGAGAFEEGVAGLPVVGEVHAWERMLAGYLW